MTRARKRARAVKLEREIETRLANLARIPRVRLLKERAEIKRLRTEATRLAA